MSISRSVCIRLCHRSVLTSAALWLAGTALAESGRDDMPKSCYLTPGSRAALLTGTSQGVDTFSWPEKPWPSGMVWIPAGEYQRGGVGPEARVDEFPPHRVKLDGFWMDETEVTHAQFREFVEATGYVTTAEQKPDWEELKKPYQTLAGQPSPVTNPQGPADSFDPDEPTIPKRVSRGGSFLCHADYCASYRPSARMKVSADTGQIHQGFRAVMNEIAWREKAKQLKP